MEVPDLIAALEAVEIEAKTTQRKLANGLAVNGHTGLMKIRYLAADAIAEARGTDREANAA